MFITGCWFNLNVPLWRSASNANESSHFFFSHPFYFIDRDRAQAMEYNENRFLIKFMSLTCVSVKTRNNFSTFSPQPRTSIFRFCSQHLNFPNKVFVMLHNFYVRACIIAEKLYIYLTKKCSFLRLNEWKPNENQTLSFN